MTNRTAILTAFGQHDSHALKISATGQPNRSPRAGQPYQGITWVEILARAAAPTCVDKSAAQLTIPSSYRAHDGRSHEAQKEHGRFHLLAIDIDKGNPSLCALQAALIAIVGDAETLIYSSSGAKADLLKWRVLIPLAQPIAGKDYTDTQRALFAALAQHGIECDPTLDRTGQPVFLPNVPPKKRDASGRPLFYATAHQTGPRLDLTPDSTLIARREAMRAREATEAAAAAERAEQHRTRRLAHVQATGDDFDPIKHFNSAHSVAAMLSRYGFEKHQRSDNYRSPLSESGSYSTQDRGDHWVTVSAWAANHGVGRRTNSGNHSGDAFDLYAHFEHGGDFTGAMRAYAQEVRPEPPPPAGGGKRAPDGRFTGNGLKPFTGDAKPTGNPTGLLEARMKTAQDIDTALADCMTWDGTGSAPVHAIKSDPGLGKSRFTREKVADPTALALTKGDVHFYSPTLALSDEAADHALDLQIPHAVTRGRLAKNLVTGETMCARPAEVERVGKLGQPIKPSMCIAQDEQGQTRACPFYDGCAHRKQFLQLPEQNALRFEALNYLALPDAAEGRDTGLRVIDETFWKALSRDATITIDAMTAPRDVGNVKDDAEKAARNATIADLLACVDTITAGLRRGAAIMETLKDYSANDLAEFATAERWSDRRLPIFPDAPTDAVEDALKAGEALSKQVGAKAQFWRNLSEAKKEGIEDLQNVVFQAGYKPKKASDPRDVIKIYWHVKPPTDAPTMLLDADADSLLIEPFFPGHKLHKAQVLPNADVTYITDRTFSKGTLLKRAEKTGKATARDEWRSVIAVERMRDPDGGVLVIASRKVVVAFFEDAGHSFADMQADDANAYMIDTPLHGVNWAWFGAMTLGSNRWQNCTTCIVMGREEWPVDELENAARAIWSHGLQMIEPDENGQRMLPIVDVPFPMADGTTYSVEIRAHPDPRVRAIHMQSRECATRQGVERLRLASAKVKKRVIIGSKVPIPGLPADKALTWAEYMPAREVAALAEADGCLRLSPKGMAADAPMTFPTPNAAKFYAVRGDVVEGLFGYHTANNNTISGVIPKSMVLVAFKIKGARGSQKTRAILTCHPTKAEAVANSKWGDLVAFEVLRSAGPSPQPDTAALEAAEARSERIAIIQEGEGLEYAAAARVADGMAPVTISNADAPPTALANVRKLTAQASDPPTPTDKPRQAAGVVP